MAKIHTHYDNLKVARKAPQEVIRAAYKALSQKYHPDKNPGDEKAARIMAILNSAYGTLADPLRRREHDDWIAAEEWEIAWLESTHAEEHRGLLNHEVAPGTDQPDPGLPRVRAARRQWWLALVAGLCLGGVVVGVLMSQTTLMPGALARSDAAPPVSPVMPLHLPEPPPEPASDNWAVGRAQRADASAPPEVRALSVTELKLPARAPDCDMELHTLVAPNGERWPAQSGYLDGYARDNPGSAMQIMVDNSANPSPVMVKLVDLGRRANVRHVYVLPYETFMVDNLAAGKYELRYQNIHVGGTREDCLVRRQAHAPNVVLAP